VRVAYEFSPIATPQRGRPPRIDGREFEQGVAVDPCVCRNIPHIWPLEHDCARCQQALGDAAGFMHADARRRRISDTNFWPENFGAPTEPLKSTHLTAQERVTLAVIFENGQIAMEFEADARGRRQHQWALIPRLRRLSPNRLFCDPSSGNACG
jgi:hypothetical protein